MTTQADWLADIGAACDELGYGILVLEPSIVRVVPLRGRKSGRDEVEVQSHDLSGDYLRQVLVKLPEPTR